MIKIGITYELRNNGGVKPTWRRAKPYYLKGTGEPIKRSLRILSNKEAKKWVFK